MKIKSLVSSRAEDVEYTLRIHSKEEKEDVPRASFFQDRIKEAKELEKEKKKKEDRLKNS